MDLPNPDDFKNSVIVLPDAKFMARDKNLPAVIRMAAAELADEEYSTVGAVLSGMCAKDIAILLAGWLNTLAIAKGGLTEEDREEIEEGDSYKLHIAGDDAVIFLIFTMMVARAETGEIKADPYVGGLQAELMASFMGAVLAIKRDENIYLDLTKLSLDLEFLNLNFDSIVRTDNFKSIKLVNQIKKDWIKLRGSKNAETIRQSNSLKNDLSPSPLVKAAKKKKNKDSGKSSSIKDTMENLKSLVGKHADHAKADPEETPSKTLKGSTDSLSDFEERLRRRFSGG